MSLNRPEIIQLPKVFDKRGNLTFIEGLKHIPFEIKRTYWIYDVPGGETRGGHAYKTSDELIIALSGSFDVILDSGKKKKSYQLNRSYFGLYLPAGIWRHMENFSTNALALVLSSTFYNKNDYIRDFKQYTAFNQLFNKQNLTGQNIVSELNISKQSEVRTKINDCSILQLNRISIAGSITSVSCNLDIPFSIPRIFYLYDIPGGESRGAHAHKDCHQLLIAASGAFDIALDDGISRRTITLNRPDTGLHIPPGIWAAEQNFSSGSICLVLTSNTYNESDYIRTYEEFLNFRKHV